MPLNIVLSVCLYKSYPDFLLKSINYLVEGILIIGLRRKGVCMCVGLSVGENVSECFTYFKKVVPLALVDICLVNTLLT